MNCVSLDKRTRFENAALDVFIKILSFLFFSDLPKHQKQPTRKGIKDLFSPHDNEPELLEIDVEHDSSGVGFSIRGGQDSIYGDSSIFVDTVYRRPTQDRAPSLKSGDEIVMVNGHDMSRMSNADAVELLNSLPLGRVRVRARRR